MSNNNIDELHWKWPNNNKLDTSYSEYEVNEISAAQDGILYKLNEESKVKLKKKATAKLKHIFKRLRKQYILFIGYVVDVTR